MRWFLLILFALPAYGEGLYFFRHATIEVADRDKAAWDKCCDYSDELAPPPPAPTALLTHEKHKETRLERNLHRAHGATALADILLSSYALGKCESRCYEGNPWRRALATGLGKEGALMTEVMLIFATLRFTEWLRDKGWRRTAAYIEAGFTSAHTYGAGKAAWVIWKERR